MDCEARPTSPDLIGALLEQPRQFDFTQAVQLLLSAVRDAPDAPRSAAALRSRVSMRASRQLSFPASDIESIEGAPGGDHYRMTVTFLGLYGSVTPLPARYADRLAQDDDAESGERELLDVFNNRAIWMIFDAWRKYRYYVEYRPGGDDQVSKRLAALFGAHDETLRAALGIPLPRLLPYMSLLSMRVRSAAALRNVLGGLLDGGAEGGAIGVEIEEFVLRRAGIPERQRARLAKDRVRLGHDFTIGRRVRDVAGKFRIRLGPMTLSQYREYAPGGAGRAMLDRLLEFLLVDQLAHDYELVLADGEAPPLQIHSTQPDFQLGRTSWLSISSAGARHRVFA